MNDQPDGEHGVKEVCKGHTILEGSMLRLVAKQLHGHSCSYASAKERKEQQRTFRHAPLPFLRLLFVDAVNNESNDVEHGKGYEDKYENFHDKEE